MAVGTSDLRSDNLRGLEDERLVDELKKAKEELFNLRFQSATGQLDNHGRLRAVRKDIARIYTEMRERELGIGLPPAKQAAADQAAAEASAKADKKAKKGDKAKADKKADKAEKKAKTQSKDES
jgi:large subunit ribosomal protein L29